MCGFCGVRPDSTNGNDLIKLLECANCLLDIEALGKWTGYGWESLVSITKANGYKVNAGLLRNIFKSFGWDEERIKKVLDKLKEAKSES